MWDGVFTRQAERGAAAYKTACSECHGADLAGDGFAPALTGGEFSGNWNELRVGDLFERIRISMPPSGPSGVTPAQKADIVAYMMKLNKYPGRQGGARAENQSAQADQDRDEEVRLQIKDMGIGIKSAI